MPTDPDCCHRICEVTRTDAAVGDISTGKTNTGGSEGIGVTAGGESEQPVGADGSDRMPSVMPMEQFRGKGLPGAWGMWASNDGKGGEGSQLSARSWTDWFGLGKGKDSNQQQARSLKSDGSTRGYGRQGEQDQSKGMQYGGDQHHRRWFGEFKGHQHNARGTVQNSGPPFKSIWSSSGKIKP